MRSMLHLRVSTLCCLIPALAAAQPASRTAEAEQLFKEGHDLLKAGRYPEACAALEGSERLEPHLATLMNLADCRERNGELATAWGLFLQVASKTRHDAAYAAMGDLARERAARLEPRLSHLIINVPDESRIEGLVVMRNGLAMDPATWNRAMAVDGGRYTIVGKAPDHEPWSTEVNIAIERDRQSVDVPRFKALPVTPLPGPGDRPAGLSSRRKLALGIGAGALVTIGAGVALELSGRGTLDEYERTADGPARDDLYARANRKHHLAQAAGAVGVVGLGIAGYLWIRGGRADQHQTTLGPFVTPDASGFAVVGGF